MRIISGKFKGRKIEFLRNSLTRPLKDSVKENIFNILSHSIKLNVNLKNAKILDLYSGIGSFGLECLSRGAMEVTFVERNEKALEILRRNINHFSLKKLTKIINDNIQNTFRLNILNKYNIFFLDPPFANSSYIENLKLIKSNKRYDLNHIIIIHREKNSNDSLEEILKILMVKEYGRSKIIFGVFN